MSNINSAFDEIGAAEWPDFARRGAKQKKIIIHIDGGLVSCVHTNIVDDCEVEVWDHDILNDGGLTKEEEAEAIEQDGRMAEEVKGMRRLL